MSKKEWFSTHGQVVQTAATVSSCLLGVFLAYPQLKLHADVLSAWPSAWPIAVAPLAVFSAFRAVRHFRRATPEALTATPSTAEQSSLPIALLAQPESKSQNGDQLGGIARVYMAWAGSHNDDWLRNQRELYILLKDGQRFFDERSKALAEKRPDALYDRLIDPNKTTHILMVHPGYRHIAAIAAMDPIKARDPELQTEECIEAVRTMQAISAEAKAKGFDITARNTFSGYRNIPTYNAMIGDEKAHINFYFSRPYRGNLITLECMKLEDGGVYHECKNDLKELLREKHTTSLWLFQSDEKEAEGEK